MCDLSVPGDGLDAVPSKDFIREALRKYRAALVSYLYRFTRDRIVAEDLAAETMARVIRYQFRRSIFTNEASFRANLLRTAKNVWRDWERARRTSVVDFVEILPDNILSNPEDTPEQIILKREIGEALGRALNELSPQQRQVCLLMAEGFRDKEIAARLAIGVETVRTYWKRALKQLRGTMEEHGGTHENHR